MRTICIILATFAASAAPPLRVGRITIVAMPLFSAEESAHGSFYRAANLLQVQTRVELLRRFLLFREGDPYDPSRLAETERNLRLFGFLESASVTASEPHDGVVDVLVVTHDAMTTTLTGDFSNDGGTASYNVDVSQKDLFGSGGELQLNVDHGIERNTNSVELLHPAALGPYWNLDTLYSKNSDGDEEKVALERPLFSYTTPWTGGFLFDHLLRNERIFRDAEVAARFRQQHRELALWRSHVLRNTESGSSQLVGGFDLLDDSFAHLAGRPFDVIPADRHFRFLDAGYESTGFRYVKLNYVDRDLREQDFNLGRFTTFHAALSPRTSSDRPLTWLFRGTARAGYSISSRSFVLGQVSAATRAPRRRNTIVSLDARTITRFRTAYPQSFVSRVRLDLGWQLDRDVQFLADGQNGLRAYPNFAFEGSRRVIINLEHRLFLGRELLQLFGPSVAVFADSGAAVSGAISPRDMKTDAGVGLRIGIARYDGALIRLDYAIALSGSPVSHRGGVWSISTMHAF
ncbi:MAG: hypothetical protein ACXV7D_06475 [Thermoanaerobaculia bacterium]